MAAAPAGKKRKLSRPTRAGERGPLHRSTSQRSERTCPPNEDGIQREIGNPVSLTARYQTALTQKSGIAQRMCMYINGFVLNALAFMISDAVW